MTLRAASQANYSGAVTPAPAIVTGGTSDGVTYTLAQYNYGGASHQSQLIGQTTTAVSTVAKTICTVTGDGTTLTVTGTDGTNKFSDMILAGMTDTPSVGITHTAAGAPAARTYSNAGAGVVQLVMASGTYNINAIGIAAGQRP